MKKQPKVSLNHWDKFAEFCLWEMASGGPDPQIPLVAEMSKNEIWAERVWRAGCYISVYNVPFAEVMWSNWPYERMQKEHEDFLPWLQANWSKIVTRFERRTARRPEWMNEFFQSYYKWQNGGKLMETLKRTKDYSPQLRYECFWDTTLVELKRYGRYVALKLLESYNLYCDIILEAPDIRPKDAWSPRITLGELWPEKKAIMEMKDNDFNVYVNETVEDTIKKLDSEYGVNISRFQLQVALCEYRESYSSQKQYPGRSHDSELGYWNKASTLWGTGYQSSMFSSRKNIFPHEHLGELNGWEGPRKECGEVLANFGYTWTDLRYNFTASKNDMSKPIPQEN